MHTRQRAGFTLIEILIVVGLTALIATGALGFYIQSLRSSYTNEQQFKLLDAMRSFTNELVFNGSRSHEFILYNSAAAADRESTDANADGVPDDRKIVVNEETEDEDDDICPTGNFAVFVYYELPKPAAQAQYRIAKIIGYYLEAADAGPPALIRLTITPATPSTKTVEELLSDHWSTAARKTIAPRVNPLALPDDADTDDDGKANLPPQLFYKRANQNIAVCGQILESQKRRDTSDRHTYTRTFYFTVSVRS